MEKRYSFDLANYRLERAIQDLSDAEYSYKDRRYLVANNRAYNQIDTAKELIQLVEQYIKNYKENSSF